jgi:hypothetical protein
MVSEKVMNRIKADEVKNLKILIIARDPIERVFSHYNWLRMLGYDQKEFRKEIDVESKKKFSAEKNIDGNYKNYLEFSLYGEQLKRCFEVFDKKMIHILSLEKLKNDFENAIDEIFNFLEVSPITIHKTLKNDTPKKLKVKRYNIPTKLKRIEKKTSFDFISKSLFFNKIVKPLKFSLKDEEFVFNLLKKDIDILKDLGLLLPEWKTVNKFI